MEYNEKYACNQSDCKSFFEETFLCELCNKKFCKNCIYLICTICHKKFTCFFCGRNDRELSFINSYSKIRSKVTGFICCSEHMDVKYEKGKCKEENCSICLHL